MEEADKIEKLSDKELKKYEKQYRQSAKQLKDIFENQNPATNKLNKLINKIHKQVESQKGFERNIFQMQKKIDFLSDDRKSGADEIEKAQKNKLMFENLCKNLQKTNLELEESNRRLTIKNKKKHQQLTYELHENSKRISKDFEAVADAKNKMEQENAILEEKVALLALKLEEKRKIFKSQIYTKNSQVSNIEIEINNKIQEEIGSLEGEKSNLEIENMGLKGKNESLKKDLEVFTKEFDQYKTKINNTNDQFVFYKTEIEFKNKELSDLKREYEDLSKRYGESHMAVHKSKEKVGQLEKQANTLIELESTLNKLLPEWGAKHNQTPIINEAPSLLHNEEKKEKVEAEGEHISKGDVIAKGEVITEVIAKEEENVADCEGNKVEVSATQ